jgi:hypothetical protein
MKLRGAPYGTLPTSTHPSSNIMETAVKSARWNLAFLLITLATTISLSSALPHQNPFSAESVTNFIRQRCGSSCYNSTAIWIYEGFLTDPTTGKIIVEVEGLELVRPLLTVTPSNNDAQSTSTLGKLSVGNLLFPRLQARGQNWDSANTILSRRLFCYRRPSSTEKGKSSLLTSIRLRPDGPLRPLSPLESIAVYDSAITYISRNDGREMVVFSEGGGNTDASADNHNDRKSHYVLGVVQSNPSEGTKQQSSTFEYTIHARKGSFADGEPTLPPVKLSHMNNEAVTISPPRSRLIHFGKSSESTGTRKYDAAQETYSYSFDENSSTSNRSVGSQGSKRRISRWPRQKPSLVKSDPSEQLQQCTVRYTRYGEAPPWYAPGRMCTLDLTGRRTLLSPTSSDETTHMDSIQADTQSLDLPPLVEWAASQCQPSFWSGWPSMQSGSNGDPSSTGRAIDLFCTKGRHSVSYDLDDENTSGMRARVGDVFGRLQSTADRLRKSLVYEFENEES